MPVNPINIRTEEIDEILGKTPGSIIRWGVTLIFAVVILLLTGSWFFKYPDRIASTIEITTVTPPAVVVAKSTGKIDSLAVNNNQEVRQGQLLAIIENPANYNNVFQMKSVADSLANITIYSDSLYDLYPFQIPEETELGELQNHFTNFVSAYNNLVHFINLGYYGNKIESVENQIYDYNIYYNYTYDQKRTMIADFKLAERDYNRNKKLFENGVIPESELDQAKSRYLNKKYAFERIRTQLANIKIQISQLENSIIDLQLQQSKETEQYVTKLKSTYDNLKAQISIWENRYLLKSPITGICVFTQFRKKNQNISVGEQVMTIAPDETEKIVGRLLLPVKGAGKVKTGQRVNVKLDNYPYMEYGQLEGIVNKIASVPDKKGFYYAEVQFPQGMTTSYGKKIPFSQNLQGTAEIITEDIRLLYRILQPLRSLLIEKTK